MTAVNSHRTAPHKPRALIVFLEIVGHIHGIPLPRWANQVIDFVTEEYAKLVLRLYGAYRRYDRVVILEDARATGPELAAALTRLAPTHRSDLLLLVHGRPGALVGYRGLQDVGAETFTPLLKAVQADPAAVDLRMVFGVNCYGASLIPTWLALGAQAVNGPVGVNWLPEPSISVFLRHWLAGAPYSHALEASHRTALRWGQRLWPRDAHGRDHAKIAGSRQMIAGVRDITIHD